MGHGWGLLDGRPVAQHENQQRLVRRPFGRPRNRTDEVELSPVESHGSEAPLAWEDQEVSPADATQYRAATAMLNCLSIGRPGLYGACEDACRRMARPENRDWEAVKRIARYILGRPRIVRVYKWQSMPASMNIQVGSNWARCTRTRKRTSGASIVNA